MNETAIEENKVLPERLARSQVLLDAMPDLMFILDSNGIYLDYKSESDDDLYKSPNDFLGKSVDEVLPPGLARRSIRYIKRALKSRRVEIFGYQLEIGSELHDYECRMNAIDDSSVIAIVRDITEQRLQAEKFSTLIESAPDPLLLVNPDGCIVFVNKQTCKHFGYLRKELIGKNFEKLIPERFRRGHFQHVREYFLKPTVRPMGRDLELFALRKDGSEFPVDISLSPIKAREGMMAVAAIRDITFRKQAEEELAKHRDLLEELVAERTKELQNEISEHKRTNEELRTAREYLDTVILNMPAGLAILEGPEFRYFRINHELADINGLSVEEHLGRPLAEVLPHAAKDILPVLQKVLDTGEATPRREFSTRLPKDPDEVRHFIDTFFPIKGENGKVKAVGVVVLDIGERKRAEEILASQEKLYRTLIESIPHVIWLGSADGQVTFLNKAWQEWTGRQVEESLGSKWAESVHAEDAP